MKIKIKISLSNGQTVTTDTTESFKDIINKIAKTPSGDFIYIGDKIAIAKDQVVFVERLD